LTAFLAPALVQAQAAQTRVGRRYFQNRQPARSFVWIRAGLTGSPLRRRSSLNCSETIGSILVAGTNGITIAAGANGLVVLRRIQLISVNVGLVGVQINSGRAVPIEGCVVTQFAQHGIRDSRTAGGTRLFIKNAIDSSNTECGISVAATAADNAVLENVYSINNAFGVAVAVAVNNNVVVSRSVLSGNSNSGVAADAGAQLNERMP
jgi:hypothetical protein